MPAYLTIIRPLNGVMSAVAVYIGSVVAGAAIYPNQAILLGMLAVFLISGGGMVINDIFDAEIDRVNRPKRPIPSGAISKRAAYVYAAILFVVGNFIVFYYLGEQAFYVALLATFILAVYNSKLKRIIMAGHIAISFLVALTFVYGGIIFGDYSFTIPLAVLAFLSNVGREIYKTIDDALGDRKYNINTIAIKFGVIKARIIAGVFVLAAVILSFVPYYLKIFNEVYLFFVVIADIIFVSTVALPLKYSSKLTKAAMLVALIAFLAGAYSLRVQ